MGLRINQNIAALNAARNLRITDGSMSKSLERLSSGFRINRAADDPAGLIISENLRAQVAGLGQAIRNSNNAVNLIKTAEAALDELLKQVRSIRTLALDALNTGASDAVARSADQTQIASSIESINRIATTTQFGKIKLLNGSSGVRGSTNDVNLQFVNGTTKTLASTYTVDISQAATKGSQTFNIRNEFAVADGGAATVIKLGTGGALTFQIDFGLDAAGANLSASDTSALGADLKAAGLDDDTSVSGVKVDFDSTNAIVYVSVDKDAGNFTADVVETKLLDALNGTKLGKVMKFNESTVSAEELQISGKVAGARFTVRDVSAGTLGKSGFTANTTAVAGSQGDTAYTFAASQSDTITIDFGAIAATTSERESLAAALVQGGLKSGGVITRGTSTITLTSFATTGATAGTAVVTISNGASDEYGTAKIADVITDLNSEAASGTGLGRFIRFGNSVTATKLDFVSALGAITVKDGGGTGNAGFDTTKTGAAVTPLATAEADKLGSSLDLAAADVVVAGETLTVNDSTVVEIKAGTALTSVVSLINAALDAEEIEAKGTFTADTTAGGNNQNALKIDNKEFGSVTTKVKSTKAAALAQYLGVGTSNVSIAGKDVAGTVNGVKATGSGQFLTLSSTGDGADGIEVKYVGTVTKTGLSVTVTQDSLVFQVGSNSGQTVKQALDDVRANKLGLKGTGLLTSAKSLKDIDVTTVDGANDALKLVDDAIKQITTLRGNLGAFQANVLESNIASLGVAQENLAAAESSIRDADFADETVQFTRNQILLQAGTAILTQANAIPQAVLQLLR